MTLLFTRFAGIFVLLVSFACRADEPYRILTSIRPLALITQDLVREAGLLDRVAVEVLLTPGQSAHHHALKLSQVKQLKAAHTIIWVGEDLEQFLTKSIQTHASGHIISFTSKVANPDPHRWLNASAVNRVLDSLARQLQSIFPGDASVQALSRYQAHLSESLKDRVARFSRLDTSSGLLEYHDSLSYFLEPLGVSSESLVQVPEQQLSLKSLLAVKSRTQAKCLVADVEEIERARAYASKLALKLVEIDLLATDETIQTFPEYTERLVQRLKSCF